MVRIPGPGEAKKGQFRLDTRRNEVIEETHYYCSENELIDDDGNMTIPTKIDGKDVYEDDGYLYGYNLVQVDDYDVEVIFTTPEQGSVVDWCKKHEWDYDRIVKSLVSEIFLVLSLFFHLTLPTLRLKEL